MNQRFGAWSQLITLFRLVYEGGQHGEFKIPGRKGYLFDPDRYPFLEGRQRDGDRRDDTPPVPRISDGIVFNVLQNLLILDGERLSYRTLDVEQIGSVYETVMGFNLEVAEGKSIAIKPIKVSRSSGNCQSGSTARNEGEGSSEMAEGSQRPENHRCGPQGTEGSGLNRPPAFGSR